LNATKLKYYGHFFFILSIFVVAYGGLDFTKIRNVLVAYGGLDFTKSRKCLWDHWWYIRSSMGEIYLVVVLTLVWVLYRPI